MRPFNKNAKEIIKKLNFEDSNDARQNINYGQIYDSLKKTNNNLYQLDLLRITFMLILSLIIFFDFYFNQIFGIYELKGILLTFSILEITFTYLCYEIKNKKKVKKY